VPLLPPELARPFSDQATREAARNLLARRDRVLRSIEALADRPANAWSPAEMQAFPGSINGVDDPPPQRVSRWSSLFAEELAEVHRIGNMRVLGDVELQETLYLAGRLLSTVSGWPIEDVDGFEIGGASFLGE
jgi:hypothetical protein